MKKTLLLLLLLAGVLAAKAQTTTDSVTHITTIKNSAAGTVTTIDPGTSISTTVNSKTGVTTTVNLLTGVTTTVTTPNGSPVNKDKLGDDSQWKPYVIGATSEYRATVLNANFTIPLLRFNRVTGDDTKRGSVSLFNSVGAGVGVSWGRLEATTDNTGNTINTEMNNTFGIQLGVLFAANTNGGNQENIFAPTISMAILNFHVGYGYELGTVSANQKRGFFTIAYGIPLSKLIKGGFYILKRTADPVHTSNKAAAAPAGVPPANQQGVSRSL